MAETYRRRAERSDALRRTLWVVIDQLLSSASNFGLAVLVARNVTVREFGIFGLVMACLTLVLGVTRGSITQPLSIRFATRRAVDHASAAAGATLLIGLPLSLLVACASLLTGGGNERASMLAFAVVLPFVLLQDTFRFVFVANGTARQAALNDAAWCALQALFLAVVLLRIDEPPTSAFILAWGIAAAFATAMAFRQARSWPAVQEGSRFLVEHRDLGTRFAAEFLFQAGATQITLLLLAVQLGAVDVGAVRGAQTLLGVYFTLFMGVMIAAVPEAARLVQRRPEILLRALSGLSLFLCALACVLGSLLMLVPSSVGEELLGDTWRHARPLLLATTAVMAAIGGGAGGFTGLRVLERAAENLRIRVVTGVAAIAFGVCGAAMTGANGAMWGLAAGQLLAGVMAWAVFVRQFRSVTPLRITAPPQVVLDGSGPFP